MNKTPVDNQVRASQEEDNSSDTLESMLARALKGLRYGSVEIVVHDAKIVQIERKEKFRPRDTPF
jgi:hypothetical protein